MLSVRTAFLSDLHLGSRWCRASELAAFLETLDCESLYLVGDIIDGWSLKRKFRWPSSHTEVLVRILECSKRCRVVYITGNHDGFLDGFAGQRLGNIEIRLSSIHVSREGLRFLVFHGDEVDRVSSEKPWLAQLGDCAYSAALWTNQGVNALRKAAGLDYRSFSQGLKQRVKEAVNYVSGFEKRLALEARLNQADGVICGHIHKAAWHEFEEGIFYGNCGDWVESCSTLVEHFDGSMEVLDWEALKEVVGIPAGIDQGEKGSAWDPLPPFSMDPASVLELIGQR